MSAEENIVGQAGLCACCDEAVVIAYVECVVGPVCQDCKRGLAGAQSQLKRQKLLFCRPDLEWRESDVPRVLDVRALRDGRDES